MTGDGWGGVGSSGVVDGRGRSGGVPGVVGGRGRSGGVPVVLLRGRSGGVPVVLLRSDRVGGWLSHRSLFVSGVKTGVWLSGVLYSDGEVSEVMGDPTVQRRVLGEGV